MPLQPHVLEQLDGSRDEGNRRGTIRAQALAFAADVLEALEDGEIDGEYGYGRRSYRAESVTLAGGGPGAEIIFAFGDDDQLDHAYLDFYGFNGAQTIRMPDWAGAELAERMGVS